MSSTPPTGSQVPTPEINPNESFNPSPQPARTGKNARKREARKAAQAFEARDTESSLGSAVNLSEVVDQDAEIAEDTRVDKVVRFDLSSAVVPMDTKGGGRVDLSLIEAWEKEEQNSGKDMELEEEEEYFATDEMMQMDAFMPICFKRYDPPAYDYPLYNPSTSSVQVHYISTPKPIAPPIVAPVQPDLLYQPHTSDIDSQDAIYNLWKELIQLQADFIERQAHQTDMLRSLWETICRSRPSQQLDSTLRNKTAVKGFGGL